MFATTQEGKEGKSPWSSPGLMPPQHSLSRDYSQAAAKTQANASAAHPCRHPHRSLFFFPPRGEDPTPGWKAAHGGTPLLPTALPQPCTRPAGLSRDKRRLRTLTGFYSSGLTRKSTNSLWKKRKKPNNPQANVQNTRTVCVSQDRGRAVMLRCRMSVLCRDVV